MELLGLLMWFGGGMGEAAARASSQQLQEDLLPLGKDGMGALISFFFGHAGE